MTVEVSTYAIEVAPLTDYLASYIAYVAQENVADAEPHAHTAEALHVASLSIGRACELIQDDSDVAADRALDTAGEHLEYFAHGSSAAGSLPMNQSALMLGDMVDSIRARDDSEALTMAYDSLRSDVIRGARSAHNRIVKLEKVARKSGVRDDELDGLIGHHVGLRAEQVSLAALMSFRGVFAAPALVHHDRTTDGAASHDLVAFAKPYGSINDAVDSGSQGFLVRRLQVKNRCLGFCQMANRTPNSTAALAAGRICTGHYYQNIVMLSGHCDFGESESGIRATLSMLSRVERGVEQTPEEQRELSQNIRNLVYRMLNPSDKRVGKQLQQHRLIA